MSSTSTTCAGPRDRPERALHVAPGGGRGSLAWRSAPPVRSSSRRGSSPQRRPSSAASDSAGWRPAESGATGSGGTYVIASAAGAASSTRDDLGCQGASAAEPALLPGADERARRACVRVSRTARGEREPPAGALAAAPTGQAVGAPQRAQQGAHDRAKRGPAGARRDGRPGHTAGDAARGNEQVDEPRARRYVGEPYVSVTASQQLCAGR